jgi:translation initiation factor 1A
MGKNIHGGSSHKKFARKFAAPSAAKNNRLRISEDPAEVYAIATKMLGSCMFHCYCVDGVVRLCHIRGKFSGRGKRDNLVECGKWILVGLREWSDASNPNVKKSDKMQQCDLLNVYSDSDKHRLKETVNANWSALEDNDVSKESQGINKLEEECEFTFATDQEFERDRLIEEMGSSTAERVVLTIEEEKEIDIDDI